jgi:acetyl-CoA C-acetyltransferase
MTRQKPDASSPVIAGVSSLANRPGNAPVSVLEMMRRAVEAAVTDVSRRGVVSDADVLAVVDLVITPRGTWRDTDPGRAAVRLLGGPAPRSVVTEIGVLQQSAVHRAVEEVRSGAARAVVIIGGEAKYSADRAGVEPDPAGSATEPDEIVRPHGDLVHRVEIEHGVVVPAQQYALIESAIARAAGRSDDEQAHLVAELWAEGSRAVRGRDDAWRTVPFTAEEIASGEGGNRMISSPYRRAVVSSWNVDQSVALLVTSAETARSWGLADDQMMGLVGSATTDLMVPLVARADLAGCPAFSLGAAAIVASTGVHPRDADVVDLYSCFPSAVEIAARDLGLEGRPWTVTGGMATFGGPFNSYALHGIAAVADHLRGQPGRLATTTCVSGLLTKVAVAVWSTGPSGAVLHDVTDEDRSARATREVVDALDADSPHVVVAHTVAPAPDGAETLIEIVEDSSGRRALRTVR